MNDADQRKQTTLADGSVRIYDYDTLGQVRSAKRYWGLQNSQGVGPVPGQQFEYGFDDIGNRGVAKSGGDASGAASGLRSSGYTVNTVNQYTERSNPPKIDVMGLASPWAAVSVNGDSTGVYRQGQYYRKELTVANYSYPGVAVSATAGSMSATAPSGNVFVPASH